MARMTLILALLFALVGAVFYYFVSEKSEIDPNQEYTGDVVFATKDIAAGEVFTREKLEIRQLPQTKISQIHITSIEFLLERRAKHEIPKGQSIYAEDVIGSDFFKWTSYDERLSKVKPEKGYGPVFYANQYVPEGQKVSHTVVVRKDIELSKIPQDSIRSRKEVLGTRSKYGFSQGQIISKHDLIYENSK